RDGSICGNGSMSDLGCARHYKAHPKTICPICNELTYSDTGICSSHGEIYKKAWRE
ncbi:30273_t:CDS:1, partial [Racocetra persica]